MIEINLLPHREARRAADLRESLVVLVFGSCVLAGGIWWMHTGVQEEIAEARRGVRQLEANIERFRPQQEKVAEFKAYKQKLTLKLDVIEGLDRARSGPLRLLDELAERAPERLWLTGLSTEGRNVTLQGESLDTGVVADFLRSLNESKYFDNVDLDQTSRGEMDGLKVVRFSIRAVMTNPVEAEAADEAAGQAA